MKQKEFLNGNLVIGKRLYNFLYTVLCVVVLVCVLISFGELNYSMIGSIGWSLKYAISLLIRGCLIAFIGYKLLNKNNYI